MFAGHTVGRITAQHGHVKKEAIGGSIVLHADAKEAKLESDTCT